MKLSTQNQQRVAVGVTLAMTFSAAVAWCPPQYQESFVAPSFAASTSSLLAAISAVDVALSGELEMYSQRINSAIAVLTKQKAVAANQIAEAQRTSTQMTAEAMNVMAQTDRVKAARFEYGGEFGQGFQPCKVYSGRTLIANRDAEMGEERRVRIANEVVAAPGRFVDPIQAQAMMAKQHKELFCTQDEVDSGLCAAKGSMPGASVNVATLFEPVMEGDSLYTAKTAFVNNVVGAPDAPVPANLAKSPAAEAYLYAKAQKDALMSPAVTSLKELQLEYSGIDVAHGGSDIPMGVRVEREVKRYLGNSPEYEAWAKTMAAQNTRGLLVEALKVKALDLALLEREYRQQERLEGVLSSLVGAQLRNKQAAVAAAADRAQRESVRTQIK
jgi:hypothetical protein